MRARRAAIEHGPTDRRVGLFDKEVTRVLRYTGHPLVDVGAATIAALAEKWDVEALTDADVDKAVDFMMTNYVRASLKSFLNIAFFDSGYSNPANAGRPEKRAEYAKRMLVTARRTASSSTERCAFTGGPAIGVGLSPGLRPGRVFRQHVPLLTAEGRINFHSLGNPGLTVSADALLCIQAFPLGSAKCGGRLLLVHSDNPDLTRSFAGEFLRHNRQALLLSEPDATDPLAVSATAGTFLVETLLRIEQKRLDERSEERPSSVTAYHLTSHGRAQALDPVRPPLTMYHLPMQVLAFLGMVQGPSHKAQWNAVVERAWWQSDAKGTRKSRRSKKTSASEPPRRNVLYEDLLRLPLSAGAFLRRYLLRVPTHAGESRSVGDPRQSHSVRQEIDLVSWELAELFVRKVVSMDEKRIEEVRTLGDRLADYVEAEHDTKFLNAFFDRRYDQVRRTLLRANWSNVRHGREPLIKFEPYLTIFEEGDELPRVDWRLARDLVLVRLVEQLHKRGWIRANSQEVPDPPAETGESE